MRPRELDFRDLAQLAAEVRRLLDGGYHRLGNWTLGQTCDHLAQFFENSMDGFRQRAPWWLRVMLGPLLLPVDPALR